MNESGKAAYQYYCEASNGKSLITGDTLPTWENLKPSIRVAWNYTANCITHDAFCWAEKPNEYLACDRALGHKGKHSWENSE